MKTTLKEFTIKELVQGTVAIDDDGNRRDYEKNNFNGDSDSVGLYLMNGNICVRPPYQRDFVWKPEQQYELINSLYQGMTIPPLTFADVSNENKDYKYEVVDGQQRLVSICKYVYNHLSMPNKYGAIKGEYHGCANKDFFLNQKIYVLSIVYNDDEEKTIHFRSINYENTTLTPQEIRNSVYYGPFVEALKKCFGLRCGNGCKAAKHSLDSKYVKVEVKRQELTELALEWQILKEDFETTKTLYNKLELRKDDHAFTFNVMDKAICDYMHKYRNNTECNAVWDTFCEINAWIHKTFESIDANEGILKIMKNVKNWAWLYFKYKDIHFYPAEIHDNFMALYEKRNEYRNAYNIFEYVLLCLSTDENNREKVAQQNFNMMDTRSFSPEIKQLMYDKQHGICPICKKEFANIKDLEAHHIVAWAKGGRTVLTNCELLCKDCHNKVHGH